MDKVIICALNSKYIHASLAPWCLLSGIETYGKEPVDVEIFEGTVNQSLDDLLAQITAKSPTIVAFSCYIWNITVVKSLVTALKISAPSTIFILGGPEVSYNPQDYLGAFAHYVISGEGERPLPALLDAIATGSPVPQGFGISYGTTVAPPYTPSEVPPSPYCDQYFDRLNGRIAYIESSRGCPFSCAFCLSGRCGTVRYFSLEDTQAQLLRLANSGTRTIKFVDRTFNANGDHAYQLVSFIIDHYGGAIPSGVCVHFEIGADILTDGLIALLQSAPKGSIQLEIGLQSFNPNTLEAVVRRTNLPRLLSNVTALLRHGNIHVHIDLIAGLPHEDMVSFRNGFNQAYALQPQMLQMGFLKILPGSPMAVDRDRYPCTYRNTPPYEVIATPWMSAQELERLHLVDFALDKLYCSGRFHGTVDFFLRQLSTTPFDFFLDFGTFGQTAKSPYLLCQALLDYGAVHGCDSVALRDVLVEDWLATNASATLPPCLVVTDQALGRFRRRLEEKTATRRPLNTKRGVAILYGKNMLVYADYHHPDPVTGRYTLHYLPRQKTT